VPAPTTHADRCFCPPASGQPLGEVFEKIGENHPSEGGGGGDRKQDELRQRGDSHGPRFEGSGDLRGKRWAHLGIVRGLGKSVKRGMGVPRLRKSKAWM
jgi:hypothetical protein